MDPSRIMCAGSSFLCPILFSPNVSSYTNFPSLSLSTVMSAHAPGLSVPISPSLPMASAGFVVLAFTTSSRLIPSSRNFDIVVGISYTGPFTFPVQRSVLIVSGFTPSAMAFSATFHENEPLPCPTSIITPLLIA